MWIVFYHFTITDEEGFSPPQATRFEPVVRRLWLEPLHFHFSICYKEESDSTLTTE